MKNTIQPGMRVTIPFGTRKITGFVIELTDNSSFDNLKSIINILDVTPVLTDELLQLGQWLANETLSLYISTFQAMLPQVLKSKYDKEVSLRDGRTLPNSLVSIFKDKKTIGYDELIQQIDNFNEFQREVKVGNLDIKYIVKSQITKKYEHWIIPENKNEFILQNETLPGNAHQQRKIVEFFISQDRKSTR